MKDSREKMYYTIHVREKLGEQWSEWFDDMTITTDRDGSRLTGYLADQAALHGMIARVQRLGLQLVSVNQQAYEGGIEMIN